MNSSKNKFTHKLSYVIDWGSETISEITLKRPKARHLMETGWPVKPLVGEDLRLLLSSLSGQPEDVIDMLDGVDLSILYGGLLSFFADSPVTGKSA